MRTPMRLSSRGRFRHRASGEGHGHVMDARYLWPLAGVAFTAGIIALIQQWLGIPPLILFVTPIAVSMRMAGVGSALMTIVTAALVGDFFFVEPVHEVTVHTHGLRLLLFLGIGAAIVCLWTALPTRHTCNSRRQR